MLRFGNKNKTKADRKCPDCGDINCVEVIDKYVDYEDNAMKFKFGLFTSKNRKKSYLVCKKCGKKFYK